MRGQYVVCFFGEGVYKVGPVYLVCGVFCWGEGLYEGSDFFIVLTTVKPLHTMFINTSSVLSYGLTAKKLFSWGTYKLLN